MILKTIKKTLYILSGAVIAAIALNLFLKPHSMAPGGLSGVAVLISSILGGKLPVGVITLVLNLPLFVAGYKMLGKKFMINSLIGTVAYSVIIDILAVFSDDISELLHLSDSSDSFVNCIWGGIFLGIGLGLIFKAGATTGGTDIAARLVQKRFSYLTLGQLVLYFDVVFLVVVAVTYRSIYSALYTGIAVFVSSKLIDAVVEGVNYAKEIIIITDKPEEISSDIMVSLDRGVTKMDGCGMYSGKSVSILWCVIYNRQLPRLRRIVDRYDPSAFVSVCDVREVKGLLPKN